MTKRFKDIRTKNIANNCRDNCCLKEGYKNQCGLKYNFLIDLAILHYSKRALKTKTMGNQQVDSNDL